MNNLSNPPSSMNTQIAAPKTGKAQRIYNPHLETQPAAADIPSKSTSTAAHNMYLCPVFYSLGYSGGKTIYIYPSESLQS